MFQMVKQTRPNKEIYANIIMDEQKQSVSTLTKSLPPPQNRSSAMELVTTSIWPIEINIFYF